MLSTNGFKHVTNRQRDKFVNFARQFGVSREDLDSFLNNENRRNKFFSELDIRAWFEKVETSAEEAGAKAILIPNVLVDHTRSHSEAVMIGAPDTWNDRDVLKVGDRYEKSRRSNMEDIVLLDWSMPDKNYGFDSYRWALDWAESCGLNKTLPRDIFAVGEVTPILHQELGTNIILQETTGYMHHTCRPATEDYCTECSNRYCEVHSIKKVLPFPKIERHAHTTPGTAGRSDHWLWLAFKK